MELQKKQFKFKGMSLEELKALDVREFSKFLTASQRRTVMRQFQEIEKFVNRAKEKIAKKKQVKTHTRYIIVVPEMVGMRIMIYNGKTFMPVDIIEEMLGHRFGELAPTRGRIKHDKTGAGATKGSKPKSRK